jgi:hypothetical protein
VGRDVSGGPNKRVEWSAKSELKDFSGDVTFEVRGEILAATLFIQNPSLGSKFKRGKTAEISWTGGNPGESIRLDLLKGGAVISQVASIQNNQRYSWNVPKSVKNGGDYQLRLSGESGTAMSGNFKIKSGSKFVLIALPVAAVGVGLYFLLKPKPDDTLPAPPEYTGQ